MFGHCPQSLQALVIREQTPRYMRESVALCVICTVHVFVWLENSTSTIHACIENRTVVTAVYNFQATIGVCSTKKPGAFDFVARAKWNAWSSLGDLSKVGIIYLSFVFNCFTIGSCYWSGRKYIL